MRIQKGKPIFDRRDTIDFSILGEIIEAWLVKFKDDYIKLELESYPCYLTEQYPENAQENYLEIIDKMIYAFADVEPKYSGEISMVSGKPQENGMIPFDIEVSDEDAWEKHMQECEEHQQKVDDGLVLFGEYFRTLWV